MDSNGIQAYRKTNVVTADPKRLVIMCYEGAIDNLRIYAQRNADRQFEAKGRAMAKALDFINTLMSSIDFERGGAIAKNLDALYNFMTRTLILADLNRDTGPVEEVLQMLVELKETWEKALRKSDPSGDSPPMQHFAKSGRVQPQRRTGTW